MHTTQRTRQTIATVLAALLLCFQMWAPVKAQEAEPVQESTENPSGTIEIRLKPSDSGRSWNGVEFEAFRCAQITEGEFEFLSPFQDCTLRIDQLNDSESMKQALQLLNGKVQTPFATAFVLPDGTARFESLPWGLYLIRPSRTGEYDRIESFLAMLPAWNEEKEMMEDTLCVNAKTWPLPDLEIVKIDPQKQPVLNRNFAFASFSDAAATVMVEEKQGDPAFGAVTFRLSLNQTLYLKESRAPSGYQLSDEIVKAFLGPDGCLYINGRKKTASKGRVSVEYVNEPEEESISGSTTGRKPETGTPPESTGNSPDSLEAVPVRSGTKASTGANSESRMWMLFGCGALIMFLAAGLALRHLHKPGYPKY